MALPPRNDDPPFSLEAAAPVTEALAAQLDRREAEADSDPQAEESWAKIKAALKKKLR